MAKDRHTSRSLPTTRMRKLLQKFWVCVNLKRKGPSIVGKGFNVHDIPTPQARPEITIGNGKPCKAIDGNPQPRCSLFPAQIAPGWDRCVKGRFRCHCLQVFPGSVFPNRQSTLCRFGFPNQTRIRKLFRIRKKAGKSGFFLFFVYEKRTANRLSIVKGN